jgi:DNA-binding response OmpR family regulator
VSAHRRIVPGQRADSSTHPAGAGRTARSFSSSSSTVPVRVTCVAERCPPSAVRTCIDSIRVILRIEPTTPLPAPHAFGRVETSVDLLLMTAASQPTAEVMPALGLLAHSVRVVAPEVSVLIDTPPGDVVLVDARHTLAEARGLCRLLQTTGVPVPVLAVLTEGGLAAVASDWGVDDVLLDTAGPAEVEARLRLSVTRRAAASAPGEGGVIRAGDLAIDETTYTCRLRGRPLDLTYKEFELLKFLAQHPGRVFSRAQLLQEVWGYDYYGGTRTVDVHVRRLRAKLGTEHEQLIGTVRNVGYKFVRQPPTPATADAPAPVAAG